MHGFSYVLHVEHTVRKQLNVMLYCFVAAIILHEIRLFWRCLKCIKLVSSQSNTTSASQGHASTSKCGCPIILEMYG